MSYYYLISGLPDLKMEMDINKLDFTSTFETITRNIEKEDARYLAYLIYPNDVRNFLEQLFAEFHELEPLEFKEPNTLEPELIKNYRSEKNNFPEFMLEFIIEFEDRFPSLSMRELENQLFRKFHEEVHHLDCPFLQQYFQLKTNLDSLIAAFNKSNHPELSSPELAHSKWLMQQIGKDLTASVALLRIHPYAEQLAKAHKEGQPMSTERYLDQIIWEFSESHTAFFNRDTILAYTVKLLLLWRWKELSKEKGLKQFSDLQNELKHKVRSPQTPVL